MKTLSNVCGMLSYVAHLIVHSALSRKPLDAKSTDQNPAVQRLGHMSDFGSVADNDCREVVPQRKGSRPIAIAGS